MSAIKRIISAQQAKRGKVFDIGIQLLIVFSAITVGLETLPDLSMEARRLLHRIEVIVIGIFTVEYLLRLYLSERKLRFIFSFYGLVDLIAIAPFYLALGLDLRALRGFRLIRLTHLLKMPRYNQAVQRLRVALGTVKEEIMLFFCFALFLLYLSAIGVHYFEHPVQPELFQSVFHSLWWAVVALTTVGYGDVYPITVGGRVCAFLISLIGIGIVAVPAGLIASALTTTRERER